MIYLELLISFIKIGLLSIGGGTAALPIIQSQVVNLHQWLTLAEFGDIVTISELTPGPIAINAATFVGTQTAGLLGALVATLGFLLPPIIILSILAFLYKKLQDNRYFQGAVCGLNFAVAGLVLAAGFTLTRLAFLDSIITGQIKWTSIFIFLAVFFVLRKWKPHPIFLIAGSGAVGLIAQGFLHL